MEDLLPIIVLGVPVLALLIPIVAILTHHQRKMAELVRNESVDPNLIGEIHALRTELRELRHRVDQHTIALDGTGAAQMPSAPPSISERLQRS